MKKDNNRKDSIISAVSGLIIGFLSGLIGIGGGEYRTPVLIYLLRLGAKFAIAANLFIGLLTVIASTILRIDQLLFFNILVISAIFIATSIIGAYAGAVLTTRVENQALIRILGVLLIVAALKVFFDGRAEYAGAIVITPLTVILSLVFGFAIGVISGFLGVAGGEFRIPALLFIFSMPIKIAGAANLLISIPTVLTGFIKHARIGHVNKKNFKLAMFMGIFSVIGAIVGASLVFLVSDKTLLIILSIIMLILGIRMVAKP